MDNKKALILLIIALLITTVSCGTNDLKQRTGERTKETAFEGNKEEKISSEEAANIAKADYLKKLPFFFDSSRLKVVNNKKMEFNGKMARKITVVYEEDDMERGAIYLIDFNKGKIIYFELLK